MTLLLHYIYSHIPRLRMVSLPVSLSLSLSLSRSLSLSLALSFSLYRSLYIYLSFSLSLYVSLSLSISLSFLLSLSLSVLSFFFLLFLPLICHVEYEHNIPTKGNVVPKHIKLSEWFSTLNHSQTTIKFGELGVRIGVGFWYSINHNRDKKLFCLVLSDSVMFGDHLGLGNPPPRSHITYISAALSSVSTHSALNMIWRYAVNVNSHART